MKRHVHKWYPDALEGLVCGSETIAQRMRTLFLKFSQCSELFSAPRALCQHEVMQMQARAVSFGNWWPVNFKQCSMQRPKMHVLTYVLGPMAVRQQTLGLTTEEVIEVLHAIMIMNRYSHLYRHIPNKVKRMEAEAKSVQRKSYAMNSQYMNIGELTLIAFLPTTAMVILTLTWP